MIHVRRGIANEDKYFVQALCGMVDKTKAVPVEEMAEVDCLECRKFVMNAIAEWR